MPYAPYKFGAMSAALLGVCVTSDGKLTVFARSRPPAPGTSPVPSTPAMSDLFTTRPMTLTGKGEITFTCTIPEKNADGSNKEVLAVMMPLIWPRIYPAMTAFSLGSIDPVGPQDINFGAFGPVHRPGTTPPSRSIKCTFSYDPAAPVVAERAVLEMKDADSPGLAAQRMSVSGLADLPAAQGGVILALLVNPQAYDNGCVVLKFSGGAKVDATRADTMAVIPNLDRLVLNTSASPQ
jgi:hypothetical protein